MGKKSKKNAASMPAGIHSRGGSSEAASAGASNSTEAEDLVASRACINCDECGAPSPQKKCANCLSYYYCSRECQVSHWRSHKATCSQLRGICDTHNKFLDDRNLPDVGPTDGPCVICLEETVTNPVIIDCGHVFCYACIVRYQESCSSQEASCPYCRGELPAVSGRSAKRCALYLTRARAAPEGSVERKKFCDLATGECDSIIQVAIDSGNRNKAPQLYMKAAVLSISEDDPKALLDVADEILSECKKDHLNLLDDDDILNVKHWRAQALSDMGKYYEAAEAYQAL